MRLIRGFLFYLIVSSLSLLSVGIIALHIFEPQLQRQFLKSIRPYVNADFEVGYINASLFENFPMASIELKQVQIRETYDSSEFNAYKIGSIFILFDYYDIVSGNWRAKKIVLEHADVKMKSDQFGKTNYAFWPNDTSREENSKVSFDLDLVEVRNCSYEYKDQKTGFLISTFINDGSFGLHTNNGKTDMNVLASFKIQDLKSGDLNIIRNKNLESKLGFTIKDGDVYSINAGLLEIEGMRFQIDGEIDNSGKFVSTNLDIEGTQTELEDMLALSPGLLQGSLDDYEIAGGSFFNAKIRGPWTNDKSAGMLVGFGIRDGMIADKQTGLKFEDINLEGSYSNGTGRTNSSSILSLRNIRASENKREIAGSVILSNFDDPFMDFALKADVDLNRIHSLFTLPAISKIDGDVNADLTFKGKLKDLSSPESISKTNFSGNVLISDLNVLEEKANEPWTDINGILSFEKPYLMLNEVRGKKAVSDFLLDGYVKNPFAFLAGKERLSLMLDIKSKLLRIEDFLSTKEPADSSKATAEVEHWPDYLLLSANVDADALHWEDIKADNVKGGIKYSSSRLEIDNLQLEAMGGVALISGVVNEVLPAGYDVLASVISDSIDISTLFSDLNNFGQDYITSKHLKGTLETTVNLAFDADADFDIMTKTFVADADMIVVQGELIGFLPMMKIGNFMKVGHFEHIVLDTLKNHFFIKDEMIEMPKMDIRSNTIDMTVSGSHSFSNVMNYHMKVNMKKLFMSQHKLNPANFMKFEKDHGGGMNVFLLVTGPGDNPEIKYDLMAAGENLGEGVKTELKELNAARLRESEMRIFKQDSMVRYHRRMQAKKRRNAYRDALSK